QFDTIYHEHFSYLSLLSSCKVFEHCGLRIFDAVQLPTHGGSLRLMVCHADSPRPDHPRLSEILALERSNGMENLEFYLGFQKKADRIKDGLLSFLLDARRWDKKVVAYGAAAKGNTILNYAGIKPDLIPYVVDASPHKQGKLLPGSRIPVVSEERLRETKPDFVLILPWNLTTEISRQLSYIGEWGGRFVTAIPSLSVFDPEHA
ncbi:MAG TPA: SAM-dependent methyltransferase, partial [Fibrobacteria bacterium]|nr:SAM-dependent methyltransferase [Fibrobacteria bacterium]